MFDIGFEFSPTFSPDKSKRIDELIITSCQIHYFSDDRIWSSFDEESYNYLNRNNYGFGVLDFEIGFTGYSGPSYPKVYTKCFRLATEANDLIKPMKCTNEYSFSKINQKGEIVISLRYHFRTEAEMNRLIESERILIESFFALDKPTNTYVFVCQMHKDIGGKWDCKTANTYRRKKKENIKWLMD